MSHVSTRIQVDRDTWLIMREFPAHPKAVIQRVTDTGGDARFLVLIWHPDRTKWRLSGIFGGIEEADKSVPWPGKPVVPGHPNSTAEERAAYKEASGIDEFGRAMPSRYA